LSDRKSTKEKECLLNFTKSPSKKDKINKYSQLLQKESKRNQNAFEVKKLKHHKNTVESIQRDP
jgi:hypothetical protein